MLRQALFSSLAATGRAIQRGSTLLHYAAAGTLRIGELEGAIERQWDAFGQDRLHIDGGLMGWERQFYPRHLRREDHILLIGCGTGRDLLALLGAGYKTDGIDIVGVETARRMVHAQGHQAVVIEGAIERAELACTYDVFIFSWWCFGLLPQAARRVRTLERLKAQLRPEGRLLISLPPARSAPRALYVGAARVTSWLTRSDWRPEPGDMLFVAEGAAHFPHYEHFFVDGDAEAEFAAAGLTVRDHLVADDGTRLYALGRG